MPLVIDRLIDNKHCKSRLRRNFEAVFCGVPCMADNQVVKVPSGPAWQESLAANPYIYDHLTIGVYN